MTFKDMIKSKNAAIAAEKKAEAERAETHAAAQAAITRTAIAHDQATENTKAAHKAIADLVAERGEHWLIDEESATLTVYRPSSLEPGYDMYQPIPGAGPSASPLV